MRSIVLSIALVPMAWTLYAPMSKITRPRVKRGDVLGAGCKSPPAVRVYGLEPASAFRMSEGSADSV